MSTQRRRYSRSVNLWSNHTSTVISISLVLMVFGLLLFLGYHSYRATHDMQERITYKVDLSPDISDSLAMALKADIEGFDYVKHVDYISKEEAAKLFTEELGDDFVGFIGYNPLYPSLMVNFKSTLMPDREQSAMQTFTKTMSGKIGVTDVAFQENVASEVNEIFYRSFWFLIIFVALLLFVSIVLINNAIRITLLSQQPTIQTMRLVGAKNSFIARPFLWRSVLYGFLGALIAIALLSGMVYAYNQSFGLHLLDAQYFAAYAVIAAVILLSGILITWLATVFATHRNLKITKE